MTTQLRTLATGAAVAPVSAVDTIVSRSTGAGVGARLVDAGGSVLTSQVRNTVEPGALVNILLTCDSSPGV